MDADYDLSQGHGRARRRCWGPACGGHCSVVGGGNFSRIPLCRGSKRFLIVPLVLVINRAAGSRSERWRWRALSGGGSFVG